MVKHRQVLPFECPSFWTGDSYKTVRGFGLVSLDTGGLQRFASTSHSMLSGSSDGEVSPGRTAGDLPNVARRGRFDTIPVMICDRRSFQKNEGTERMV
jgi:hypothetical protein